MLPFFDPYYCVRITGKRLKVLLEEAFQYLPCAVGGFLHVSGIQIYVNSEKKLKNRIESLKYKNEEIDDDKYYEISTL